MNFIFEQIRTGGDRNFGYLIGDRSSGTAAFVDPSFQPELLVERASAQNLKPLWILNTHGHSDHINGNERARQLTQAQVIAYQNSKTPHETDVKDSQILRIGTIDVQFLHVPGHTQDHLVIYIPTHKVAMTGDHLFVGKIGGTDSEQTALQQYNSLKRLCKDLPDDVTIWPGHDYGCRPSSTMALEKATNPFFLTKGFDEFLKLKITWSTFKAQYGLR